MMVDISNVTAIQSLKAQLTSIERAIDLFDPDGRIVSMSVASAVNEFPGSSVTVDTSYMTWPPQMKEAITTQLHDRLDQIASELAGLGVTGIEPQPRR